MSERATEPVAPEEQAQDYASKEDLAELRKANEALLKRLDELEKTDPATAKGRRAKKKVEEAVEDVEEAAEEVGLTEAAIEAVAEKVADKIATWADEADEAERDAKEREEKGALGKLEDGGEPPPEEEPAHPMRRSTDKAEPEPEPERDAVPDRSAHFMERRLGRRKEE